MFSHDSVSSFRVSERFSLFFSRIQEEREERHKLKKIMRGGTDPGGGEDSPQFDRSLRFDPSESHPGM